MTQKDDNEIVITRSFNAPRELMWKMWSEPEYFKKWWGPKDYTAPVIKMDFRLGGKYLYCMQSAEGKNFWSTGIYNEIIPLEGLVCTDSFSDEKGNVVPASYYGMHHEFPLELQVTVTFEDDPNGTKMTLRHVGVPQGHMSDLTRDGWNESFDKLEDNLKKSFFMENFTLDQLKNNFSGEVILPGDTGYDQVRSSFAAFGNPALVLQAKNTHDVTFAIRYAEANALTLSIRSGGHSMAGFSTNTGGMVLDLSHINNIEIIDKEKNIVRLGTGATWGEVAKKLQESKLTLSSGDTKTVGVGGLTLGGGIGWMVRKYGLAIDSLVGADVVTADGKILHVSHTENADLYWAIRGGGGNFAVVISFEFTAHPIGNIYAGSITYKFENLSLLLSDWRDYMRTATGDLSSTMVIMPPFGGNPPSVMVLCCFAGDDKNTAANALYPLKKFGTVVVDNIKEKMYADVLEDAQAPVGIKVIVKNIFSEIFTNELIEAIVQIGGKPGSPVIQIRSLGGAVKRVPIESTPITYRSSEVCLISATFVSPEATEKDIQTALKPWERIAKYGKGAYSNFLSTNTSQDLKALYPKSTYEKLVKIKKKYDPQNIFSQNYNIKPE